MSLKLINWDLINKICFVEKDVPGSSQIFSSFYENNYKLTRIDSYFPNSTIEKIVKKLEKDFNCKEVRGMSIVIHTESRSIKIILEGEGSKEEMEDIIRTLGYNNYKIHFFGTGILLKNSYFKDKEVRDFLEDIL